MIVVNKFELYRQYACKLDYNHLSNTMTNTVIVNRFNYDFTISGSGSTFNITNTQKFFDNNKTNLFFQQIYNLAYPNVIGFWTTYIDTNNYFFFTRYSANSAQYSLSWSAYLTLQVYF